MTKVDFLFSEMKPRVLLDYNIDMEGYLFGISQEGQFFASVTTSNFPFSYIDSKYRICSTNTIFLRTNLNNIAVATEDILAANATLINPEPHIAKTLGAFHGILTDGQMGLKQTVLHGFDGKVIMLGFKDLISEQSILFAGFSNYLKEAAKEHCLGKTENSEAIILKNCMKELEANVNLVDVDIIVDFLSPENSFEEQAKKITDFKSRFIPGQIKTFDCLESPETFIKELKAAVNY